MMRRARTTPLGPFLVERSQRRYGRYISDVDTPNVGDDDTVRACGVLVAASTVTAATFAAATRPDGTGTDRR